MSDIDKGKKFLKTISPYEYAKQICFLTGYIMIFCGFVTFADLENLFSGGLKSSPVTTIVFFVTVFLSVVAATIKLFLLTARRFRTVGESPWKSLWLLVGFSFPYYFARLTLGSPDYHDYMLKRFRAVVALAITFISLPFVFDSLKANLNLQILEAKTKKSIEKAYYEGKTDGYRSMVKEFRDAFPNLLTENHWNLMENIEADKNDRKI